MYIFNGAYSIFYLMHHKILMNITKCGVRICEGSVKGSWISEGLLYPQNLYCINPIMTRLTNKYGAWTANFAIIVQVMKFCYSAWVT